MRGPPHRRYRRVMRYVRELERSQWQPFLDGLTQELPAPDVCIDVVSPRRGDELAAGLVLQAMSYDPRADEFEVVAGRGTPRGPALVEHRVARPRHIWVDSRVGILPSAIAVDAEDGTRTLVRIATAPSLSG